MDETVEAFSLLQNFSLDCKIKGIRIMKLLLSLEVEPLCRALPWALSGGYCRKIFAINAPESIQAQALRQ
ncbi:MAG: hypothetical protein WD597_01035 [Balneolaceae bacterium]